LLERLKEEFYLPTILINSGNGRRPQFHIVREKLESPILLCVIEFDSA
jgi:hypothetical protein